MVDTQSLYDIEYVSGEFGETYTILILNDDGSNADISWADEVTLTVKKPDGTLLFSVATGDASPPTLASPNVLWPMLESQTTAGSSYTGDIDVQVEMRLSTTRKRDTKIFKGFIYKNQVP